MGFRTILKRKTVLISSKYDEISTFYRVIRVIKVVRVFRVFLVVKENP